MTKKKKKKRPKAVQPQMPPQPKFLSEMVVKQKEHTT